MIFYEGYTCPVCEKPFTADDDVVVCPDCGAPHHRACWKQENHCHFADTHGTPAQWSREKAHIDIDKKSEKNICEKCGYENIAYAEFCSRCGQHLQEKEWNSTQRSAFETPFQSYGEYRPFTAATPSMQIPDETDIDGVTAKELYTYTGKNGLYYVSRFQRLHNNQKTFSWNWAAFLLTPYWLWYRKQYLAGSIALILEGLRAVISSFFLYGYIGFANILSNEELIVTLERLSTDSNFIQWTIIVYLSLFISLILRVFFGAFGNFLYFKTAKKHILNNRVNHPFALSSIGGVSTVLGVVAYLLLYAVSALSNFFFI